MPPCWAAGSAGRSWHPWHHGPGANSTAPLRSWVEADIIQLVSGGSEQDYRFRSPLIRDAARGTLLRKRRRELHRRAGQLLERIYPATSDSEPELLAYHFMKAGLPERAIAYLLRAAERAIAHYANGVAINHLERALELLPELPETPKRKQDELLCRLSLGAAVMSHRGHGAEGVGANFARAKALAEEVGDSQAVFRALRGLCLHHLVRSELQSATTLAQQASALADRISDRPSAMEGHRLVGGSALFTGAFDIAEKHLRRVLASDRVGSDASLVAAFGQDPGVVAGAQLAWTLWITGRAAEATTIMADADASARRLGHPLTMALAAFYATALHALQGDADAALTHAAVCRELARGQGLPSFSALALVARGSAMNAAGHWLEAAEQLRQGLALWRDIGSRLAVSLFAGDLVSALMAAGQLAEARATLDEAGELVRSSGQIFWQSELLRLGGRLMLAADPGATAAAREQFETALAVAQRQGATALAARVRTQLDQLAPA